jgi:isopentenyl phosphate kinase
VTGELTVLKLGGSVITDKDRRETLDGEALSTVSEEIAPMAADAPGSDPASLVIVHGGGSFGHHHASEHDVTTSSGTYDPSAVLAIHGAMTTLTKFVVQRLTDRDVPAVPVHPLSAACCDGDGRLTLPTDQVVTLLEEGFVPVLHGDVVAHAGEGVTVLSGDEIVGSLARSLHATSVGLCSTVPGVLDEHDEVIDRVSSVEEVRDVLGTSDATDVSGGMARKVRTLLDLDQPASIFDPADLGPFLRGDQPGTTVD